MKRSILAFIIPLLLTSCDPYMNSYHKADYYVKNSTNEPIKIANHHAVNINTTINPGDSIRIYDRGYHTHLGNPPFKEFYIDWNQIEEQNRYVDIVSKSGKLLRTWRYTEKDIPGKQLFNESSWQLYVKNKIADRYIFSWVFDILPEDIDQAKSFENSKKVSEAPFFMGSAKNLICS